MVSHYDGFAPGIAGKPDSMLIPAFSLLRRGRYQDYYDHEHSQYHFRHGTAV